MATRWKRPRTGRRSNLQHLRAVRSDGELVATYRKIHLFDVDLAGPAAVPRVGDVRGRGAAGDARDRCRPGRSVDLLRRPVPRAVSRADGDGRRGTVGRPHSSSTRPGDAHWEVLLRARAIENQCFVAAPAQWGTFGSRGGPAFVRPLDGGRSVGAGAGARARGRDGVWFADLDMTELRRVRQVLPALQHRRLGTDLLMRA